jgi:hypothetical protein
MKEFEFNILKACDLSGAEEMIERAAAELGLTIGMKGSLASYPGCVHWHFKNRGHKGTLEITLWPKNRRIWAQVQDGRKAEWIDEELPRLRGLIERELRSRSVSRTPA